MEEDLGSAPLRNDDQTLCGRVSVPALIYNFASEIRLDRIRDVVVVRDNEIQARRPCCVVSRHRRADKNKRVERLVAPPSLLYFKKKENPSLAESQFEIRCHLERRT
jgi:hypothetical protein